MAENLDLTGDTIASTYLQLLHIGKSEGLEAAGTGHFVVDGNGTESVLSLDVGRVGIGTETPAQLLDIEKSVDGEFIALQLTNYHQTDDLDDLVSIQFSPDFRALGSASIKVGKDENYSSSAGHSAYMSFHTIKDNTSDEKMRITSDGNVGIGTTTVGADLVVSKTDSAPSVYIRLDDTSSVTSGVDIGLLDWVTTYDGSDETVARILVEADGTFGSNDHPTKMSFHVTKDTENATSTANMVIDQAGNVGIGTTSPSELLHVDETTNDTNARIRLNARSSGGGSRSAYIGFDGGSTTSGDNYTYIGGAQDNTDLVIRNNGNIGIGTATPQTLLQVDSTSETVIGIIRTASISNNDVLGSLKFGAIDSNVTALGTAKISATAAEDWDDSNDAGTDLEFWTTPIGASSPTVRMTILDSGKVGIGIADPSSKVEIFQVDDDDTRSIILSSGDIAHTTTDALQANQYASFGKSDPEAGGLDIMGINDTGSSSGVKINGVTEDATLTTKSAVGYGCVMIQAYQNNGNALGSPQTDANLLSIGDAGAVRFIFDAEGTMHHAGGLSASGMDYSEMFEWIDENASDEDRAGFSVVLVDGKVRPALSGEQPFGIVSYLSGIKGNVGLEWRKVGSGNTHKQDEYGRYIEDSDGKKIDNPDYDPDLEYISRLERKEWQAIGLLGQVPLKKGQPVNDKWIKMYKISDNADMYYIFPSPQIIIS